MNVQPKKHLTGWQVSGVGVIFFFLGQAIGGMVGALMVLSGAVVVIGGIAIGLRNVIRRSSHNQDNIDS